MRQIQKLYEGVTEMMRQLTMVYLTFPAPFYILFRKKQNSISTNITSVCTVHSINYTQITFLDISQEILSKKYVLHSFTTIIKIIFNLQIVGSPIIQHRIISLYICRTPYTLIPFRLLLNITFSLSFIAFVVDFLLFIYLP